MHPLTILAVGLYGEVLPNQNGAPLRLVVPWKYASRASSRSSRSASSSNSQSVPGSWQPHRSMAFTPTSIRMYRIRAGVRRVNGGSVSFPNVKHSLFNGYADQVAQLYAGMDLKSTSSLEEAVMMDTWKRPWLKVGVFGACLSPLVVLAYQALTHNLGANPIDEITDQTGIWTLRLLLITLAVTPARRLSGWNRLIQLRVCWGCSHFLWQPAFLDVYLARPILRFRRHHR